MTDGFSADHRISSQATEFALRCIIARLMTSAV